MTPMITTRAEGRDRPHPTLLLSDFRHDLPLADMLDTCRCSPRHDLPLTDVNRCEGRTLRLQK